MPIYAYRCVECHRVDDLFRRMDQREEPHRCTVCGGESKPIISVCGFQMPGFKNGQAITENGE
jgi:putative FmdB family regulatory protein